MWSLTMPQIKDIEKYLFETNTVKQSFNLAQMFEEVFKMIFKMRNHYQENTSESKIIQRTY